MEQTGESKLSRLELCAPSELLHWSAEHTVRVLLSDRRTDTPPSVLAARHSAAVVIDLTIDLILVCVCVYICEVRVPKYFPFFYTHVCTRNVLG